MTFGFIRKNGGSGHGFVFRKSGRGNGVVRVKKTHDSPEDGGLAFERFLRIWNEFKNAR
jgi:hypothetical protein